MSCSKPRQKQEKQRREVKVQRVTAIVSRRHVQRSDALSLHPMTHIDFGAHYVIVISVSCRHQGKADVERHIRSALHESNSKTAEGQFRLPFVSQQDPLAEKVCR